MIKFEPDSPPLVSSATGPVGNNGYGGHGHTAHQRSPSSSMCIAKKSSGAPTPSSTSPSTTNPNGGYELKREIAESSGLSLNGAPYVKPRAGRKGSILFLSNILWVLHFYS